MGLRMLLPIGAMMISTACSMVPPLSSQPPAVPAAYENAAATADALPGAVTIPDPHWWQRFNDPVLSALIDAAIAANHDVRIAHARLREARAAAGIARAGLAPQLNAGAEAGVRRDDLQTGRMGQPDADASYYQAGFDASWELDVFGGVRAGVIAAEADIAAAAGASDEMLVSVIAEVARNYIELRGAQQRVAVAERNITLQAEAIGLLRSRVRAGLSPELDIARAESDLQSLKSVIPPLQASIAARRYRIGVLTAQSASQLTAALQMPAELPQVTQAPATGLPSSLLERRPDVRRAQAQVNAANARVGVARADLFPKFYLSGLLARAEEDTGSISIGPGLLYSLAPTVRLPILSGGRIRSNIAIRDAQLDAALLRYEQTVLRSVEDVESALVSCAREQQRLQSLDAALAAAALARELALESYSHGLADYFSVLDAQRQQLAAEDSQAASRTDALVHLVALYKALGGGWQDQAGVDPAAVAIADKKNERETR